MFRVLIRRGKFNSACGSRSNSVIRLQAQLARKLALIATLMAGCFIGGPRVGATAYRITESASSTRPESDKKCPARSDRDIALAKASALLGQSRFQDAAALLQPVSAMDCDARVSLLLAAAFEGEGNSPKAAEVLQAAHAVWPSNDSIAVSLAREYLAVREVDKAVKSLAHFHATADTPEQEMQMAVVVYLAGHQLVSAQKVAEAAYRFYPSEDTLLLLANSLQMQGRYPDVNRILGNQRGMYGNSPKFFITLAESELDASNYPAARQDSERAISLDSNLYQAHYILGNVLFKLSDMDGAIAEYRVAINLAPDQPRTYFQLAQVLQAKQDEAGEQHALEEALATDSHYAPAQCEMGRILLEQHRATDAVDHLTAAIQSNPHSEKAYFLLARAYAQLGEKDKSDQMVKRLQAVKKENRPSAGGKNENHPAADQSTSP